MIWDLFLTFADMEIPAEVLKAAAKIVSQYGENFTLVGEYEGSDVYIYRFPEDLILGFPFLYLYKDKRVTFVTGQKARDIIKSFRAK